MNFQPKKEHNATPINQVWKNDDQILVLLCQLPWNPSTPQQHSVWKSNVFYPVFKRPSYYNNNKDLLLSQNMSSMVEIYVTLGTDHLTCRGGYGFLFRSELLFRTTRELEYLFFPKFNIRLYDKNSELDYFFFLHQNQNIFFSNIGNQNIFLEKNYNPPLQVKWSFP